MFAVTCRNICLGLYPTMGDALNSVALTASAHGGRMAVDDCGEYHARGTLHGNGLTNEFSVVWVRPSAGADRLF